MANLLAWYLGCSFPWKRNREWSSWPGKADLACCLIFIWFNLISSGLGKRVHPPLFYCEFVLSSRAFLSSSKSVGCVSVSLSSLHQTPALPTVGLVVHTQEGTSLCSPRFSDTQAFLPPLLGVFYFNTWEYVRISRDHSKFNSIWKPK